MSGLLEKLKGKDLRSIGRADEVVLEIGKDQKAFDEVFLGIFHNDPVIRMRAADVLEKVSKMYPGLLVRHKRELLANLHLISQQEVKWHVALMLSYLSLEKKEFTKVRNQLMNWLTTESESRIVKVNCMQALADLALKYPDILEEIKTTIEEQMDKGSPAIVARAKKLLKKLR